MFKQRKHLSKNMRRFVVAMKAHERAEKHKPLSERNILPKETNAQLVVDCLKDLILGEDDIQIVTPVGIRQANTIILDEILYRYNKEYRKIVNKKEKSENKCLQMGKRLN